MELSGQLVQFISSHEASSTFWLGHWLESLDDQHLATLKATAGSFESSDNAASHDELIKVIALLVAAEEKRSSLEFNAEDASDVVAALDLMTKIETFRRKRWLLVEQPLSIRPRTRLSIRFTPEGLKHADELRRR